MLVQFGGAAKLGNGQANPRHVVFECYEVSDPEDMAIGLTGASHLPAGTGMLFCFDKEGDRAFHMKGVNFPIDIIFIGANGRVTEVAEKCMPNEPGLARARARWVVEVPAGASERFDINTGDVVQLESEEEQGGGAAAMT
jgi:uncharacterized protein